MSVLSEQFARLKKVKHDRPVALRVWEDDTGFNASVNTCGGQGKTPEDALRNAVTNYVSGRR